MTRILEKENQVERGKRKVEGKTEIIDKGGNARDKKEGKRKLRERGRE